jgi:hypothetical protein
VGWSKQQQFARLRYIVNNQRFCVLPQGRRPNLASAVLGRALRRISADYQASYGHPVLVVKTFTDPVWHRGSCYAAAGFTALGQTLGYRRNAGVYVHHGNPKLAWARPLRRDALDILSALFDHPLLFPTSEDSSDRPERLGVGRAQRAARHPRAAARRSQKAWDPPPSGVGAGDRCRPGGGQRAQLHSDRGVRSRVVQQVLARLQARRHPVTGRYVDPDALDAAISGWLADQARAGRLPDQLLAIAVDGKACAARSKLTAGRYTCSPR